METRQIKIAPSILSADFSRMGEQLRLITNADFAHCDVMDGRFVPNITFGMKMVEDIKRVTALPLDVHLMIEEPEKYIARFVAAGADFVTFHIGATANPAECLRILKEKGARGGMAISPDVPIAELEPFIKDCDMLVLMSVYPGFSGQKFLPGSVERLKELKALRDRLNPAALIEIDGGINTGNIGEVFRVGADVVVGGNAVFAAPDPAAAIDSLRQAAR